jgi:hypothetical protein
MVRIEFQIIERVLQEDQAAGQVNISALFDTYLILPIRFSVNDVELFETTLPARNIFQVDASGNTEIVAEEREKTAVSPWVEIPLLNFAVYCLEMIRVACSGTRSQYDVPEGYGYLQFKNVEKKIRIHSTINGKTVEADCTELIDAFGDFSRKAQRLAEDWFPELTLNSNWTSLFS